MPPGFDLWINTVRYSVPSLIIFGLGCVLWLIAYLGILVDVRRNKFVGIPAAAVVANVSWEVIWSFVYRGDTGWLLVEGYRGWVFLDFVIVYCLFRYGPTQVLNPALRKYFRPAVAFGIVSWLMALYYFVRIGLHHQRHDVGCVHLAALHTSGAEFLAPRRLDERPGHGLLQRVHGDGAAASLW